MKKNHLKGFCCIFSHLINGVKYVFLNNTFYVVLMRVEHELNIYVQMCSVLFAAHIGNNLNFIISVTLKHAFMPNFL